MLNTIHPVLVAEGNVVKRKDGSTVARPLAIAKDGSFAVKLKGNYVAVDVVSANRVAVTNRSVEFSRYAKRVDLEPKAPAKTEVKVKRLAKPKASVKAKASAATPSKLLQELGLTDSEARQILALLGKAK